MMVRPVLRCPWPMNGHILSDIAHTRKRERGTASDHAFTAKAKLIYYLFSWTMVDGMTLCKSEFRWNPLSKVPVIIIWFDECTFCSTHVNNCILAERGDVSCLRHYSIAWTFILFHSNLEQRVSSQKFYLNFRNWLDSRISLSHTSVEHYRAHISYSFHSPCSNKSHLHSSWFSVLCTTHY